MKTCGVCGKQYRIGKIAFVMHPTKGLTGKRVCQPCAGKGVLLVAAEAHGACSSAGCKKKATKCDQHAKERAGDLSSKKLVTHLKALARVAQASEADDKATEDFIAGRVEGLEAAVTAIESGRFA
ncbi:MAG: hypothetical protein PVSMB8_00210 [Vulcanimicrobiaceae bacterium]